MKYKGCPLSLNGKKDCSNDVDASISSTVSSSGILNSSKSIGRLSAEGPGQCYISRIANGREL